MGKFVKSLALLGAMCYTFVMDKKLKRVIAIIALVFVGIFSVSFVAYLLDQTLLNGAIGLLSAVSGGTGLALFIVIKLSRDNTDEIVDAVKDKTDEEEKSEGESETKEEENKD